MGFRNVGPAIYADLIYNFMHHFTKNDSNSNN